jgi:hypothetical protein
MSPSVLSVSSCKPAPSHPLPSGATQRAQRAQRVGSAPPRRTRWSPFSQLPPVALLLAPSPLPRPNAPNAPNALGPPLRRKTFFPAYPLQRPRLSPRRSKIARMSDSTLKLPTGALRPSDFQLPGAFGSGWAPPRNLATSQPRNLALARRTPARKCFPPFARLTEAKRQFLPF